ncbi:replicative DNA helicase [Lysobacter antibioticus]|uniref:Replicative DNA helicase n=1 Tax=Lysobacter antibioticus TaxID=84531 RepID=A0A0S2F7F5_LYSAN|nr:replicative DNA helicase [Lysobacter antibioticus]ALN79486.1 replicative DNA helicase [Lysobacter antibioticus]
MSAVMRDERDVAQLRVPPQAVDAEQNVLGGLMVDPAAYDLVADVLVEEDFYRRDHQLIYRAIRELAEKSRPFDAVTLGEWFDSQGLADQVAKGAYLIELASTTWSAANVAAYAEIVRDKAVLRQLIDVGTRIANDGFQPEGRNTEELLADAQTRVNDLTSAKEGAADGLTPVSAGLAELFSDLQGYYAGTLAPGIPLPWKSLRDVIPGMADGDLIIVAGRPGMGKSVFGTEVAMHVAETEGVAALFSLEMSKKQLNMRLLSALSGISATRMKTPGEIADEEWPVITQAMARLKGMPLHIDDTPGLTIHRLRARVRRLRSRLKAKGQRLRLVVVDYLQLMAGTSKRSDNRTEEVSEISRGLKLLAKESGCPVVALSQLNRSVESRQNKRPAMSDLRESGAIEQDADVIVFLYREDYYNPATISPGVIEAIVAKQRSGPTETAYLRHDLPCSRFHNREGGRPEYDAKATSSARADRWGKQSRD